MAKDGHSTQWGKDTPGSTSTLKNRPAPPPYTTVEAHCFPVLDESKLHPLFAAAYRNKTKSRQCRLPDAVLIRLMRLSDNVTVECLRRTSRVFLRLFPVAFGPPCWTEEHLERHPWPISRPKWLVGEQDSLLQLIDRDQLCEDCAAAKAAPDWLMRRAALLDTYLHCSGCQADHAACLFSASERCKPQSERLCIGHEGYMRLCEHETVSWSVIAAEAAKKLRSQTKAQREVNSVLTLCRKTYHKLPYGSTRLANLFRRQQKSLNHLKQPGLSPYPVLYTRFEEHSSQKYTFTLQFEWSSHISLAMKTDGRFEAEDFKRQTESRFQREGKFICPQSSLGMSLSQMFCDPVRCDCLAYAGMGSFDWGRPLKSWVKAETCRSKPSLGLYNRLFAETGEIYLDDFSSRTTCCSRFHRGSRYLEGYHNFATIVKCEEGKNCFILLCCLSIAFTLHEQQGPEGIMMDPSWYACLDPDSYRIFEDNDGFGVYWCKSKGCRNYYRFAQFRLNHLLKDSEGYWRLCST